jgi:hypothetical protein
MQELESQDFCTLLSFVQELYTPKTLDDFFPHALGLLPKIAGSDISLFSQFGVQSNAEWFCDIVAINHKVDQLMAGTSTEYFRQNPTIQYYLETQCSDAVKISDFLSESELHRCTALYDEFLQPIGQQDQMAIVLIHPGELALVNTFKSSEFIYPSQVMFSFEASKQEAIGLNSGLVLLLHRQERSFQERDRIVLNLLRPHFLQAYQNSLVFSNLQQHRENYTRQRRQPSQIALSPEVCFYGVLTVRNVY